MGSDLINSGIYEPWRIVPVMVVLFVLFSLRHFKVLDEPPAQHNNRSRTIDGLRGFLALGVFFAHGSGYYVYMKTGYWGAGPSVFFNQLGSIGVALFFIITSYLFWGKAVAASSHTRNAADYRRYLFSLYTARFFRIAPLYYLVIALMLAITLSVTGPHLNVSAIQLVKEIGNWMLLGLGANVWINGYGGPPVMTGMVWTLGWEWYFYFSLALTSLIAFSRRFRLAFSVAVFLVAASLSLAGRFPPSAFILLFSIGMIFASLRDGGIRTKLPAPASSIAAVALLAVVYAGYQVSHPVTQAILLAAFFYLITHGCDIFGLLRTRAAQRLGAISYGIYLTHGICLHLVFSIAPLREFAIGSVTRYWSVVSLTALVVTGFSSLTFVFVERPGIALGRSLLRRSGLSRTKTTAQPAAAA